MTFKYNRINMLGISIYETVCMSGEIQYFEIPEEVPTEKLPNVLVFAGAFTYGDFPNVGSIELRAGSTSEDLPMRPKGKLIMTAKEDGAQYYCIHRFGPFGQGPRPNFTVINAQAGDLITVPKGHIAVIGKGEFTIDGTPMMAPHIVGAKTKNIQIAVMQETKGLEVWV